MKLITRIYRPLSGLTTRAAGFKHSRIVTVTPVKRSFSRSSWVADVVPPPKVVPDLTPAETFLSGPAMGYVEEMYENWLKNPESVHVSWQSYFKNLLGGGKTPVSAPPNFGGVGSGTMLEGNVSPVGQEPIMPMAGGASIPSSEIMDHMKVQLMVRAYQVRGHHMSNLDPLQISKPAAATAPELDFKMYGFSEQDLDRTFYLGSGILYGYSKTKKQLTLREIIDTLKKIYCSNIGIEYAHIPSRLQCDWLRERFEIPNRYTFSQEEKKVIMDRLVWSDHFEKFVATKFPSVKRFGLEGAESLIPGMKALIDQSVELGVESIVMGMPHRGRLNVLSNVVRKPNESIFSEFSGIVEPTVEGSGDVKYHLGMSYDRPAANGKKVHLSLVANPSHLEAVDPVVQGKVRAMQFYANDEQERGKAMAVLLHGDASFAAQGVVYETLGFAELPAYSIGGTIHIIVNNQIGFTTDPRFSRSTPYCSDVAKTVSAPIIHVNGDDVEAVVFAMKLASEWRAKWKKDVVIDLVCYRRHGHNEIDQPAFTQPLMYARIKKQPPVIDIYSKQLVDQKSMSQADIDAIKANVWSILEEKYNLSKSYKGSANEWLSSNWSGVYSPSTLAKTVTPVHDTGFDMKQLASLGVSGSSCPESFNLHNNLAKILKLREKAVSEGEGIDWATAEMLAFASLLAEGTHVRLSGQDVERGTFSQRHAVLYDQKTEDTYTPLNHLVNKQTGISSQAAFTVSNSSLSEFGTLGFELGYSLVSPQQLTLWEAQFGDFANNAQCIIDQFISSGEQKWMQRSALTMLLPHGYDGQGPEHSSARMERYLQLCDEDPYSMPDRNSRERFSYARQHQDCNMQVAYPSVPGNYFHLLRRQVHREFRKPLVIFTSKALLRHPLAKSSLSEMASGTRFQRLIPEVLHDNPIPPSPLPLDSALVEQSSSTGKFKFFSSQKSKKEAELGHVQMGNNPEPRLPHGLAKSSNFSLAPPAEIKTVIFCSGQVYYLLYKTRELNNLKNVAIVRIEQIAPFPFWEVADVVDFYPNVKDIVWCQEEHQNGGAWQYVEPRLETAVRATQWWKSGKGKRASDDLDARRTGHGIGGLLFSGSKATTSESVRGGRIVRYAGRDASAAPATGNHRQHLAEEQQFLAEALLDGQLSYPKKVSQGVPLWT